MLRFGGLRLEFGGSGFGAQAGSPPCTSLNPQTAQNPKLKEITGEEFRAYRASIGLLEGIQTFYKGSYNGNYPPENVLD